MLLGIVKRGPNEDALLPLEAAAGDVCVGDPGHDSIQATRRRAVSQGITPITDREQHSAGAAVKMETMRALLVLLLLALVLPASSLAESKRVPPADRAAINRLLDEFVPDVVAQKDLKRGWALVGGVERTVSYRQWLAGNTSVQTYPAKGRHFHGWLVNYAYPGDVGFDILLQPTKPSVGAWSFRAEAQKIGGRWKITTWYPVATFAPPGKTQTVLGPNDLGANDSAVAPGTEKGRVGAWALLVPVVAIGLLAAACFGFVGVRWARRRGRVREIQRALAR
jgi:hypothetical protein